jgi:protein disulfide-isomerase
MKVEIWSDIACPFCYIGKHHFESALKQLPFGNSVEVDWKSFELDPYAQFEYEDDLYTLLANKYGQSRQWAINSAEYMRQKGNEIGLAFNFEDTKSTNTFKAHQLIHLAKSKGLQNEAEEALFEAYFRDGLHIGKVEVLIEVGKVIGLEEQEVKSTLNSDIYSEEVRNDELESRQLGIRAVPYFVIDRKFGISGAQPIDHFVQVLTKAHQDKVPTTGDNDEADNACSVDGCD